MSATARRVVGVFLSWTGDPYAGPLVSALADAAKANDVDIIVFAAGRPASSLLGTMASEHRRAIELRSADGAEDGTFIYRLATPDMVDGLVVLSGTLSPFLGVDGLRALCAGCAPLPVVSVAVPLPDTPSVLVDNMHGIRSALEHLVSVHHRRNIAFIRGPATNPEAEERFAIYRQLLARLGLPYDPQLVSAGTLDRGSGIEAIARLCNKNVSFDAVMAANDSMALAAIEALHARGLRVPGDVSVVGFDDIEEASFQNPPLTTVRQPIEQQAQRAIELLLARIDGEPVPEHVRLSTQLVRRRSCGCPSSTVPFTTVAPLSMVAPDAPGDYARTRFIEGSFGLARWPGWGSLPELLFDAFRAGVEGRGSGPAIEVLEMALACVDRDRTGPTTSRLHLLRLAVERLVTLSAGVAATMVACELRAFLEAAAYRAEGRRRLDAERRARKLNLLSQASTGADALTDLVSAIEGLLPELAVQHFVLALFENPADPSKGCRVIFAHDLTFRPGPQPRTVITETDPGPVATTQVLKALLGRSDPGRVHLVADAPSLVTTVRELGRSRGWIVEPLHHGQDLLGFLVMDLRPETIDLSWTLREALRANLFRLLT